VKARRSWPKVRRDTLIRPDSHPANSERSTLRGYDVVGLEIPMPREDFRLCDARGGDIKNISHPQARAADAGTAFLGPPASRRPGGASRRRCRVHGAGSRAYDARGSDRDRGVSGVAGELGPLVEIVPAIRLA
jgi:hypothetical protein